MFMQTFPSTSLCTPDPQREVSELFFSSDGQGEMWKAELEKGTSVFPHHLWKPTDRKIEAGEGGEGEELRKKGGEKKDEVKNT